MLVTWLCLSLLGEENTHGLLNHTDLTWVLWLLSYSVTSNTPPLWQASLWLYLIDCIRPVLGLEAETGVLGIDGSTLALQWAVQGVACVKLDAGLGGVHFQYPPTSSVMDPGDEAKPHIGPGRKSRQGQVEAGKQLCYRTQPEPRRDIWRRQGRKSIMGNSCNLIGEAWAGGFEDP